MTPSTADSLTQATLYGTDFVLWLETPADQLKNRDFDSLDLDPLTAQP